MYRFSRSLTQNFVCRTTMVADVFEDFEPPSKHFLATPLSIFRIRKHILIEDTQA